MNEGIQRVLKQKTSNNRDGIDMAVCAIHHEQGHLVFAGAKNPLCYVENGQAHIIKGTNNPVGGEIRPDAAPFVNHQLTLKKGTSYYLFSDGYQDQFGGAQGKKLMSSKFRALLLQFSELAPAQQRRELERYFQEWKGAHAQLDDVLVMGFRV
jgi:phosphoserine phosphatase RsbU/P